MHKCSMCPAVFRLKVSMLSHEFSAHQAPIKKEPFLLEDDPEERPEMLEPPPPKISSKMVETLDSIHVPRGTLIQHSQDEVGPHVCSDCGKEFEGLMELANHVKVHIRTVQLEDRKKTRGKLGRPRKNPPKSRSEHSYPKSSNSKADAASDDAGDLLPIISKRKRKRGAKDELAVQRNRSVKEKPCRDAEGGRRYSLRGKKLSLAFLDELKEKQAKKSSRAAQVDTPKICTRRSKTGARKLEMSMPKKKSKSSRLESVKCQTTEPEKPVASGEDFGHNMPKVMGVEELKKPAMDMEESLSSAVANAINIAEDISPTTSAHVKRTSESRLVTDTQANVSENTEILAAAAAEQHTVTVPDTPSDAVTASAMGSGVDMYEAILNLDSIDIVPMVASQMEESDSTTVPVVAHTDIGGDSDAIEFPSLEVQAENAEEWFAKAKEEKHVLIDEENELFKCVLCDEIFKVASAFQRHYLTSHQGFSQCSECFNYYSGQDLLDVHECPVRRPKRTTRKPKKLAENEEVETRGGKEDDDGALHVCEVCGKRFAKALYLSRHMQGHSDTFKCVLCNKRFARKQSLLVHNCIPGLEVNSQAKGKEHFCQFCGAGFTSRNYLLRHMSAHTGEFKCEKCLRSFARKETLRSHVLQCNPELVADPQSKLQAHQCKVCKRVFGKELTLKNHMKLHTGEYKCSKCQKSFVSELTLSRHQCLGEYFTRGEDGKLHCKECDKKFDKEIYLQRHMVIHMGTFRCVVCQRAYARKEEMLKHMLDCTASLHTDPSGGIECYVCKETFQSVKMYRDHFLQHTHPYKCKTCGKLFMRQSRFENHKCDPWDGNPLECKKCHKKFKYPVTLKKHMEIHENKQFECKRCHKVFHREDYVKNHMCVTEDGRKMRIKILKRGGEIHIEPGSRSFVCPDCGRNYSSISNLNKHMITHGDKKEECPICQKRFHLKVSLKEHMAVHDNSGTRQCPHCGKMMKSRNSIYNHIQQFHAQVIKVHPCQECNKTFLQKGNLKKHMLLHSSERRFKCLECGRSFKYPEQLKRHEHWHREGLRYQCELCENRFLMEADLRKHTRNVHSGIVYKCKYCHVDCSSWSSMIRHLRKLHGDIEEWQEDPSDFIKGLINPGKRVVYQRKFPVSQNGDDTDAENSDMQPAFIDQDGHLVVVSGGDSNTDADSTQVQDLQLTQQMAVAGQPEMVTTNAESPYVVAEIKGLSSTGETLDSQTVIIQTGENNQASNMNISQEVAEALQQLSSHGALDAEQPTVILGDLTPQEAQGLHPVMLSNAMQVMGQGMEPYIVVPMMNQEDVEVQQIQI